MNSTASRVPLMTGLPMRTRGSTVIRSRQFGASDFTITAAWPPVEEARCVGPSGTHDLGKSC